MKLFGNSAYGKTVTRKFVSTSYGNEGNIFKKINSPTKREIRMDLPLQIGVAVYRLAKLRMLD